MNEEFIFSPNKSTNVENTKDLFCTSDDCEFIDKDGNGRTKIENHTTLAKLITKDNNKFYQIKVSSNNQLFNPFSKFDREKSYSFLDNVVRPTDKFINVNKTVFDFYLKFVSTKNIAWLNRAERERA